jgi:hypothetical protein
VFAFGRSAPRFVLFVYALYALCLPLVALKGGVTVRARREALQEIQVRKTLLL